MAAMKTTTSPSGPSTATIKRLYALSGNRCSFPDCRSPLIDGNKVVGRICHIKAQREGGPRYDAKQTAEQRHGYGNLILMCSRHHDIIDDDESTYTADYLQRLKADHEQRATALSQEDAERGASLLLLDQSVSSTNQSGGITAQTVHVHNYPQASAQAVEAQPESFIGAQAMDGKARFRAPDQPLGLFWEMVPFAQTPDIEVFLAKGPALWLRLMRNGATSREWSHDELLQCGRGPGVTLRPLVWTNLQYLRAEDGIGAYSTIDNLKRESETQSVIFAFTTGEIWCVDTTILGIMGQKHLYFQEIARTLVSNFRGYGEFLRCLGIQPPFKWIAGVEGVKGWRLKVPPPPNHVSFSPGETCLSDTVVAEGTYDLQRTPAITLRPFLNQLFRKCGMTAPNTLRRRSKAIRGFEPSGVQLTPHLR
jgi:hypothetical protein